METEHTRSMKIAGIRATMYAFLAAMFNRRPDRSLVNRLHALGVTTITGLTQVGDLSEEAVAGLSEIAHFVESIDGWPDEKVVEMLAIDWTRLFRGVAPDYGPEPPYETVYVDSGGDDSAILQAVVETYRKYGVAPERKDIDRPDYIGVELDFLALLAEREQEAWGRGDIAGGQNAYLAAQQFFRDHVGRWIGLFCDRAITEANTGFYRGLLRLTRGMTLEMEEADA